MFMADYGQIELLVNKAQFQPPGILANRAISSANQSGSQNERTQEKPAFVAVAGRTIP
jgi:hypothetical protein